MAGYTVTGPFTAGSAPGLSAAYNNAIEAFIQQLEGDIGAVVLNGATSGTATLYQVLQGTHKKVVIILNNFKNIGGSTQTITFPTAFTAGCQIRTTAMFQIELRVTGAAQNIDVLTTLGAAGGTVTTQTNIAAHSLGVSKAFSLACSRT